MQFKDVIILNKGDSDSISNTEVYWIRVTAFIPGLGASIAFDEGKAFPIRGLHAWQAPQIPGEQQMMPMSRQLGQAPPFAADNLSAPIPLVYWTRRPWRRIDLVGPVSVEFSSDPYEIFPGPITAGLLRQNSPTDALIRHASFFVAGFVPAVAAQFSGIEFDTIGMPTDGSSAMRIFFLLISASNTGGYFDGNFGPATVGTTVRRFGLKANNFPADTALTEVSLGSLDEVNSTGGTLPAEVTATPRRMHFGQIGSANAMFNPIGAGGQPSPQYQISAQNNQPSGADRRVFKIWYTVLNTRIDYWTGWTEHTVNDPIS